MDKSKVVLLIPSLEPDQKLIGLVKDLKENNFNNIFIVNDGSNSSYDHIFNELEDVYGCKMFRHYKNLGKGRALKNAFNQILNLYPDFEVCVSLDSDGQHTPEDCEKVAQATFDNVDKLVLGVRKFDKKEIPLRSRFGNILTSGVLKVLCGIAVSDTQTGLRGFTKQNLIEFIDVPGERFEYEMNMILATREKGIKMVECPIQTIYLEENKSSHFNPIKDSIRIYSMFLSFILVAISSFLIDLALFYVFIRIFKGNVGAYIYLSTILARIISSLYNFLLNKSKVFKNKSKSKKSNLSAMLKYYALAVIILALSSLGVDSLVRFCAFNEVFAKILIDGILFILSFFVQRDIIFKK